MKNKKLGKYGYWRVTLTISNHRVIRYLEESKTNGETFSRTVNRILRDYVVSSSYGGDDANPLEER